MSNLAVSTQQVAMQQKKQPAKQQVQQKPQESVSFFDEKWSGHQIAKLTGDNDFTDWLQNKDKVCTDGKDDGKIGLWEGVKSFGKGLIGGIPKAIINHPLTSIAMIGLGAAATKVFGKSILVPMTALGLGTGVWMSGSGIYKAATAKTDGEAKEALETCGMGVTTTALATASAGKVLDAAAKEGVQSAQVHKLPGLNKDANIFQKTWHGIKQLVVNTKQLFKATPEALKVSGHNAKNTYTMLRFNEKTTLDGTKQMYDKKGNLNEELLKDGTVKTYKEGQLSEEVLKDGTKAIYKNGKISEKLLPDGTKQKYSNGKLSKETLPDGTYREYGTKSGKIITEIRSDGSRMDRYIKYNGRTGNFTKTTLKDGSYNVVDNSTGNVIKMESPDGGFKIFDAEGNLQSAKIIEGNKTSVYTNGKLVEETLPDGSGKSWYENDQLKSETLPNGSSKSWYVNGQLKQETLPDGSSKSWCINGQPQQETINGVYKVRYENGQLKSETLPNGSSKSWYENGQLKQETLANGSSTTYHYDNGSLEPRKIVHIDKDGSGYVQYGKNGYKHHFYKLVSQLPSDVKRLSKSSFVQDHAPEGHTHRTYVDGGWDRNGNYYMLEDSYIIDES